MKKNNLSNYLLWILAGIFLLNVLSTFFRHTEIYLIGLPHFWRMSLDPSYFKTHWKYSLIWQKIEEEKKLRGHQSGQGEIIVATDTFDLFSYEFNLFPYKVQRFNPNQIDSYRWVIINPKIPEAPGATMALQNKGWVLSQEFHDKKEEYQIWQRKDDKR